MKKEVLLTTLFLVIIIVFFSLMPSNVDMESFEKKLGNAVNGEYPYIDENTTLKQFKIYYDSYKPMSAGLVRGALGDICD
jgi:hypothetical protein